MGYTARVNGWLSETRAMSDVSTRWEVGWKFQYVIRHDIGAGKAADGVKQGSGVHNACTRDEVGS